MVALWFYFFFWILFIGLCVYLEACVHKLQTPIAIVCAFEKKSVVENWLTDFWVGV